MKDINNIKFNNILNIDLLSNPKILPKWVPQFISGNFRWKICTGCWTFDSINKTINLTTPQLKPDENICIFTFSQWKDYSFQLRFKIISQSINPPEGGVVLYFRYKNPRNYYSIHFCISKKKIEFIKRTNGSWKTLGEEQYDIIPDTNYLVTVNTQSEIHRCKVNGNNLLEIADSEISSGCIGIGAKYCGSKFSDIYIRIMIERLSTISPSINIS